LIIHVNTGYGIGATARGAFDAALYDAGIHNYNLIELSSVIPPGTQVERRKFEAPEGEIGHRLYVVLAHAEAPNPGSELWAGLGWVQDRQDGHGVFLELTGPTREAVEYDITVTLEEMVARRRGDFGSIHCEVAQAIYEDRPAAAVVTGEALRTRTLAPLTATPPTE